MVRKIGFKIAMTFTVMSLITSVAYADVISTSPDIENSVGGGATVQ